MLTLRRVFPVAEKNMCSEKEVDTYTYIYIRVSRLNDLGVELRIIFQWIFKKQDVCEGSLSWIDLAKDRDKWRALVNTVMVL
jgi:hypothetical protein